MGVQVVLAPIEPTSAGNGLAMRTAQFVDAARETFEVVVAVVPAAGRAPGPGSSPRVDRVKLVQVAPAGERRSGLTELVSDARWRERFRRSLPFPALTGAAPPSMAPTVCRALEQAGVRSGTPVHVVRSYLGPLGLAVAERLGSSSCTLDLDDDDEELARDVGDPAEADAYHRLVATFAPAYSRVCAASPREAVGIGDRHGLEVTVVPNTVVVPPRVERVQVDPPDLIFVGNLSYVPNIDAALTLVTEVLPTVRRATGQAVTATIAGSFDPAGPLAALARADGVGLLGYVDEVAPLYARAAAAVVPLRWGSGTSIKLLEAFAHRVPVVATPVAARGLAVVDRTHLLMAEQPSELAEHVVELVAHPERGMDLAQEARTLVERCYSRSVVAPVIRAFLDGRTYDGTSSDGPARRPGGVASAPGLPGADGTDNPRSRRSAAPQGRTPSPPGWRSAPACVCRRTTATRSRRCC